MLYWYFCPLVLQANDILLDAARRGKTEVAKALIRNGADANYLKGTGQETPLHLAAANGHPDTVKALMELLADPRATIEVRDFALPQLPKHAR